MDSRLFFLIISLSLIQQVGLNAQYGAGSHLQEAQVEYVPVEYSGGVGRGEIQGSSAPTIIGLNNVGYIGGSGRGDSRSGSHLVALGLPVGFVGGLGRGDGVGSSSSGIVGMSIYGGGVGKGDVRGNSVPNILGLQNIGYSGGTGRGDRFAVSAGVTIGLPVGFTGGLGRGDAAMRSQTGIVGLSVYTGGLGRGDVRANADQTIIGACSVSVASSNPEVCIDSEMPTITHSTYGVSGIGDATGIPPGIDVIWASDVITLSGTPTVTGIFEYSIPLLGGCDNVAAVGKITVFPKPIVTIAGIPEICGGEPASITAMGGVEYAWSTGEMSPEILIFKSGAYSVTVSDAKGCTAVAEVMVVEKEASGPASIIGDLFICTGSSSFLTANGCGAFLWNTGSTAESIEIFAPGTYSVTITYSDGTNSSAEVSVSELPSPIIEVETIYYPTYGMNNGSALVSYEGGTEPIELKWSNGVQGPLLNYAQQGIYGVNATDANGCSSELSIHLLPIARGNILWSGDTARGIRNVSVIQSGDVFGTETTDENGYYGFSPTASDSYFTITPLKHEGMLNGVTAADASRIQRHVVLLDTIQGPYQLIAADVNGSNGVSNLDAILLVQCILDNPTACNHWISSWRFVDAMHTFSFPQLPWGFPETIELTPNYSRLGNGLDFKGIKVGDVVEPESDPQMKPEALYLCGDDVLLQANQTYTVPIRVTGYNNILAYQFAFEFDTEGIILEGVEIPENGLLNMTNFGLRSGDIGSIRSARADLYGTTLDAATEFFTLRFHSLKSNIWLSDLLRIDEADIGAAAYDSAMIPHPIQLLMSKTLDADNSKLPELSLLARPNPTRRTTNIAFTLSEACEAQLRVMDVNGSIIWENRANYEAGNYEEYFNFPGQGVYILELMTHYGHIGLKVIVIEN